MQFFIVGILGFAEYVSKFSFDVIYVVYFPLLLFLHVKTLKAGRSNGSQFLKNTHLLSGDKFVLLVTLLGGISL